MPKKIYDGKKRVTIRLKKAEEDYLLELCEKTGKKKSQVLRMILDSQIENHEVYFEAKDDFLLRKKYIYEINKIGNNINQIVKNNNAEFYSEYEKKKLFALMQEIKNIVEKFK